MVIFRLTFIHSLIKQYLYLEFLQWLNEIVCVKHLAHVWLSYSCFTCYIGYNNNSNPKLTSFCIHVIPFFRLSNYNLTLTSRVIWSPSSPYPWEPFFLLFLCLFSSLLSFFPSIFFSFLNLQLPSLLLFPPLTPSCKLNLNTFQSVFYNKIKKTLLSLLPLHLGPI